MLAPSRACRRDEYEDRSEIGRIPGTQGVMGEPGPSHVLVESIASGGVNTGDHGAVKVFMEIPDDRHRPVPSRRIYRRPRLQYWSSLIVLQWSIARFGESLWTARTYQVKKSSDERDAGLPSHSMLLSLMGTLCEFE